MRNLHVLEVQSTVDVRSNVDNLAVSLAWYVIVTSGGLSFEKRMRHNWCAQLHNFS